MVNSFVGVIIVSLSDSESNQPAGPASHPKPHWARVDSRATLGDILALVSAFFYAMYVTILKVRIKSESRIDMQLFFGFVGLFNILTCWPLGLVLHLTGIEIFELPPSRKAMTAMLVNVGSLSTVILSFFTFIYSDGNHPLERLPLRSRDAQNHPTCCYDWSQSDNPISRCGRLPSTQTDAGRSNCWGGAGAAWLCCCRTG